MGLKTFVAVVEAGSFTAAADRAHMSKKLASKYVGELETRLGVQLLHRTTRSLSLTDAGHRFYGRAVRLLDDYEAMTADVRDADAGLEGVLRVSAPMSFGEMFVQPILAEFRAAHPGVTIDLRLNDRFVDLASEGFDLAVRIGQLEDSSLLARRLGTIELCVIASPAYLENKAVPDHPSDLQQHACIRDSNLRAGHAWPFSIDGQTRRIAVSGGFIVNSATAVRDLVLRGEGIGLCPDYAIATDLAARRLIRVLDAYAPEKLGAFAVFSDARRLPARARAALEHLVTAFKRPDWQMRPQA
ncbi:MAG: LysR family transcriptional regulator [Rhodobacteraceae bacterium]|nr:LysR family transcriptional regulator [Paracoccaceae bacterium]